MRLSELDKDLDSVIFDLDGTLWDSTNEILIAWNEVVEKHDEVINNFTKEDIEGFMGTPIEVIFKTFLPYLNDDKIKEIEIACSNNEMKHIESHGGNLYPGLEKVLKKLSSKYKLFIVSNCQEGYIEGFLKFYGFEKYFLDFEYIGRTGLIKGENIKLVIERNKLESSIYVGDTEGDREAANLAKIPFIYARYGFGQVSDYDYAINDIMELIL